MPNKWSEMFDVRHPFFKPLWRRVVATAACLLWALIEASNGATLWALLFAGAGGYLFWQFFVAFDPDQYDNEN